ncbi:hypothetical protein I3842_03G017800 [Carya illinoinensis]|uniref:Uncharacterized protein n=1 Tax=Carya illinoinensis TaxID=32201 RepID=A0A922JT48_CARIL|nr:hypothetical protein I3842_03G017800 [Carya illinoinensis]
MKAIILICILFAFLLISSPSIAARELAEYQGVTSPTKNPNKPVISCPGNPRYTACIPSKPPVKCNPRTTYNRCKPPQGP